MAEPMEIDATPVIEEVIDVEEMEVDVTPSAELDAAKNVLLSHHDELRSFLHFSTIHPKLNKLNLLSRDNPSDFVKLLPPVNNSDQIDKLVVSLTSSNNPQFLRQLIDCLRETAHEVRGHEELANILERALDEELANPTTKTVEAHERK